MFNNIHYELISFDFIWYFTVNLFLVKYVVWLGGKFCLTLVSCSHNAQDSILRTTRYARRSILESFVCSGINISEVEQTLCPLVKQISIVVCKYAGEVLCLSRERSLFLYEKCACLYIFSIGNWERSRTRHNSTRAPR